MILIANPFVSKWFVRVDPCNISELVFRRLLAETTLMEQPFSERIDAPEIKL
jgi:hypothetical protein